MATVTRVYTIEYAAKLLGEDPELLEAIISNDDNLTYGTIIYVCTGTDESINTLTEDGIDELRDMLKVVSRFFRTFFQATAASVWFSSA